MKIGIDIGRVIIGGDGEDTFFTEDYLSTPEVENVFGSILALKNAGHEIHLVSKCGEAVEKKTLKWLDVYAYHYMVPQHRIHFVRKRHLKAPMALALELDIFIDDRLDIIDSMEQVVPHRILFIDWEHTNRELQAVFDNVSNG